MTNELNNFVTVLNNDSDFSWIESMELQPNKNYNLGILKTK